MKAFHAFAAAHKTFMAKTTEERLNQHGTPKTFALHDRVKIYVPPTHAQILRTGRKSNHIVAWRGPCTITSILSPSTYEMEEDCSGRTFQRSIINIRPFRASRTPPSSLPQLFIPKPSSLSATPPTRLSTWPRSPKSPKPTCRSTTWAPPTQPSTLPSSVSSGSHPMAELSLKTLAPPATTTLSLEKSTLPTSQTYSSPRISPSPPRAVSLASLRVCSSTSKTNSTSTNGLPSPPPHLTHTPLLALNHLLTVFLSLFFGCETPRLEHFLSFFGNIFFKLPVFLQNTPLIGPKFVLSSFPSTFTIFPFLFIQWSWGDVTTIPVLSHVFLHLPCSYTMIVLAMLLILYY